MGVFRKPIAIRRRRPFFFSLPEVVIPDGDATLSITGGDDDAGENSTGTMFLTSGSLNVNDAGDSYAIELFRDFPAPAGSNIVQSYLKVWTTSTAHDSPNLTIGAQNSVSPATPTTTAFDISNRTRLAQEVTWSANDIGIDAYKNSPDISSVIQAYIELPGYTQGSSDIAIILETTGAGALRWNSFNAGSNVPQLYVAWTGEGGGGSAIIPVFMHHYRLMRG